VTFDQHLAKSEKQRGNYGMPLGSHVIYQTMTLPLILSDV